MLVDLKTILSGTREGGYAVGLFNCVTLEMTRGIIAAAEELRKNAHEVPDRERAFNRERAQGR